MKALTSFLLLLFSLTVSAAESPASNSVITVTQLYTATNPESLIINKANSEALKICRSLGFSDAEKRGEEKQSCERYSGWYGCYYRRVEQQYQCHN